MDDAPAVLALPDRTSPADPGRTAPPAFRRWAGAPGRTRLLRSAALAVALAARLAYVLATPGYRPAHDDAKYDLLAVGIARHGVFPHLAQGATAYRPPGYPYLLGALYALVGTGPDRILAGRVLQVVIGVAVVALSGAVAGRIFGPAASLATMALAALYPPLIAAGTSLLSEPLTIALLLGSVVAVLEWRRSPRWGPVVAAGVMAGLATLTRSNAFVVVPALLVGVAGRSPRPPGPRRRWFPAAALALTAAAVVAPWTVRNAVVMHAFIPVSDETGGTLAGTYNPVSAADRQAPTFWHLLAEIPTYRKAVAPLAAGPEAPYQARLQHLALSYAEHHPLYPAEVAWYGTLRLAGIEPLARSRFTARASGITDPAVADACIVAFWMVSAAAVVTVLRPGLRRRVPAFYWVLLALLYLTVVLVNSETPRLRLPIDPLVVVLAGAAVAGDWGRRARTVPAADAGPAG